MTRQKLLTFPRSACGTPLVHKSLLGMDTFILKILYKVFSQIALDKTLTLTSCKYLDEIEELLFLLPHPTSTTYSLLWTSLFPLNDKDAGFATSLLTPYDNYKREFS